eukprot:ctg_77.g34
MAPPEDASLLRDSAHPLAIVFLFGFKLAAIATFLLLGFFTSSFVVQAVLTLLLLAADFWTVKNVSGRLLVPRGGRCARGTESAGQERVLVDAVLHAVGVGAAGPGVRIETGADLAVIGGGGAGAQRYPVGGVLEVSSRGHTQRPRRRPGERGHGLRLPTVEPLVRRDRLEAEGGRGGARVGLKVEHNGDVPFKRTNATRMAVVSAHSIAGRWAATGPAVPHAANGCSIARRCAGDRNGRRPQWASEVRERASEFGVCGRSAACTTPASARGRLAVSAGSAAVAAAHPHGTAAEECAAGGVRTRGIGRHLQHRGVALVHHAAAASDGIGPQLRRQPRLAKQQHPAGVAIQPVQQSDCGQGGRIRDPPRIPLHPLQYRLGVHTGGLVQRHEILVFIQDSPTQPVDFSVCSFRSGCSLAHPRALQHTAHLRRRGSRPLDAAAPLGTIVCVRLVASRAIQSQETSIPPGGSGLVRVSSATPITVSRQQHRHVLILLPLHLAHISFMNTAIDPICSKPPSVWSSVRHARTA